MLEWCLQYSLASLYQKLDPQLDVNITRLFGSLGQKLLSQLKKLSSIYRYVSPRFIYLLSNTPYRNEGMVFQLLLYGCVAS